MPGLTDLFAHGVIAAAHLVKGEGAELAGVDLAVFVEHALVGEDVNYPAEDAQASKPLVAHLSSASDNLQLKNAKKARKYAIFRAFSMPKIT